jgi:hypothetical protein
MQNISRKEETTAFRTYRERDLGDWMPNAER